MTSPHYKFHKLNMLRVPAECFQHHHSHLTFRCVHALLHGASRLKHWCFEVSHCREHLLKAAAAWYNAALWVGILRNLRKYT